MLPKANYKQWRTTLLLRVREQRALGFYQKRGTQYRAQLAYDIRQRRAEYRQNNFAGR